MIKRFGDRILQVYCHPDFYPDISGDLEELYDRNKQKFPKTANWRYLLQVIMLFRWSLLRPLNLTIPFIDNIMLRNYFKISFRNLIKHKSYTIINVLGLAIGLAAFLLINQFLRFEKSYDTFHKDADQLYRLTTDQIVDGQIRTRDAMSFNPSGKAISDEIPEVTDYTVSYNASSITVKKGEELVNEKKVIMVDERFIPFFGYKVLAGDVSDLAEPNTIVLTKDQATKYFRDENPVGKSLHLYSGFYQDLKVVGVIENVPPNTHYKFDFLISIASIADRLEAEAWDGYNYYTYLKIQEGTNIENLQQRLIPVKEKYMNEGNTLFFNLQPITDIHLHSDFTYEPEEHGSATAVAFLTVISIFIIVIAWVNYINLSTAKSVDRAKEVGLRKVIGAYKDQIRFQFLVEAFLINVFGAFIALILSQLAAPYFNHLIGLDLISGLWKNPNFLGQLGLFVLIGTVVSGFYPAFMLSRFEIVKVLKGKFRSSKTGVVLRKGLVVLQFAASLILIASTFIVYSQVEYMQSRDIGMEIDRVVGFSNPSFHGLTNEEEAQQIKTFHQELLAESSIIGTATTTSLPGGTSDEIGSGSGGVKVVGKTDRVDITIYFQNVDDQYFDLLEIDFVHGRNFSKEIASDSLGVIVNEAFVESLGLSVSEDLLRDQVQFGRNPENTKWNIIGIIKNANRSTLKNNVEPTIYDFRMENHESIVKIAPNQYEEALSHLEKVWSQRFPEATLEYAFLDDRFDQLYSEDKRFGSVFIAFSVLALIVAIMGLFGLSSFMASQRTKEVGVRKVLGGSIFHIISLFYKEFVMLVGVAGILGIPVVYFSMSEWLMNYAYRIDFPWVFMIISVCIVLICTIVTVGYQVYRVAILNPAETLKYE